MMAIFLQKEKVFEQNYIIQKVQIERSEKKILQMVSWYDDMKD